ncbi:MAG: biotin carboxylase N-terminal domain-containing protein [Pseudomonadota bacterium]
MTKPRQHSVLIANRGEIACRIIQTARSMGLRTVAVYSDADAHSRHVHMADAAYRLGPGPSPASYLNRDALALAITQSGADFVHPGYGFLSENADFARDCASLGPVFVGPGADAIDIMADKARAKARMLAMDVPCIPGYQGDDQTDAVFMAEAKKMGMPIMIKAAAGGGGRGMRLVSHTDDLINALGSARLEAQNGFGDDRLLLEKAVTNARHVEIQVLADQHGTVLHLGERDCSAQRRHQKVVEEAPCPVMTPALRAAMGAAAVTAARAVDYVGAGTVEFLLDGSGQFYFLEMNTRLQVEHPVTEMVTGLDLVAEQLRIAMGHPLDLTQDDVTLTGHAIEVRLYAEDPSQDFLPQSGPIKHWSPPAGDGIRVDHGVVSPGIVTPFYDPMLAKIIAHGPDRDTARQRLIKALEETILHGVATNRAYLLDILRDETFAQGGVTTTFLETDFQGPAPTPAAPHEIAIAAVLVYFHRRAASMAAARIPSSLADWTNTRVLPAPIWLNETHDGGARHLPMTVTPDGNGGYSVEGPVDLHSSKPLRVEIIMHGPNQAALRIGADNHRVTYHLDEGPAGPTTITISFAGKTLTFDCHNAGGDHEAKRNGTGRITAPMHGQVTGVTITVGDRVAAGQSLGTLEAMKMQHTLAADCAGRITGIHAKPGAQVSLGDVLVIIEPASDTPDDGADHP